MLAVLKMNFAGEQVRLTVLYGAISLLAPTSGWPTRCPLQIFCFNGGTCMRLTDYGPEFCRCTDEYEGIRCEEPVIDFVIPVVTVPSIKCLSGQWMCHDGKTCIQFTQRCDTQNDCPDSSDESAFECRHGRAQLHIDGKDVWDDVFKRYGDDATISCLLWKSPYYDFPSVDIQIQKKTNCSFVDIIFNVTLLEPFDLKGRYKVQGNPTTAPGVGGSGGYGSVDVKIFGLRSSDFGTYRCIHTYNAKQGMFTDVSQVIAIRELDQPDRCQRQVFCFNGGTCFVNSLGIEYCRCTDDYKGIRCEESEIFGLFPVVIIRPGTADLQINGENVREDVYKWPGQRLKLTCKLWRSANVILQSLEVQVQRKISDDFVNIWDKGTLLEPYKSMGRYKGQLNTVTGPGAVASGAFESVDIVISRMWTSDFGTYRCRHTYYYDRLNRTMEELSFEITLYQLGYLKTSSSSRTCLVSMFSIVMVAMSTISQALFPKDIVQ